MERLHVSFSIPAYLFNGGIQGREETHHLFPLLQAVEGGKGIDGKGHGVSVLCSILWLTVIGNGPDNSSRVSVHKIL